MAQNFKNLPPWALLAYSALTVLVTLLHLSHAIGSLVEPSTSVSYVVAPFTSELIPAPLELSSVFAQGSCPDFI